MERGLDAPGASAFSVVPGSALVQQGLTTAQAAETALLNTMAQDHLRIFATAERFAKLRATWQNAATSQPKTWEQAAITSSNTILTQAPVAYSQDVRGSGFAPHEGTGPTNILFNFAVGGTGAPARGPVFQWLARRYGQPLYDWWENQGRGGALDALWFNDSTASLEASATPPDMTFHGDAGTAYQPQEMVPTTPP